MSKLTNMLKVLKGKLPRIALKTIYKSYIRPIAEYAAILLANIPDKLDKKLEQIQYHAGLTISGLLRTTGYFTVLDELSWNKLSERRKALRLTFFYKIINNISPIYLAEILHSA